MLGALVLLAAVAGGGWLLLNRSRSRPRPTTAISNNKGVTEAQSPSVGTIAKVEASATAPVFQAAPHNDPQTVPNAAPLPLPPEPKWVLADERLFTGRTEKERYLPYFVLETGEVGLHTKAEEIKWRHYSDEPEVRYRPGAELLLASSRVFDRWIQLSQKCPHTVKWELTLYGQFENSWVRTEADGLVVGEDRTGEGVPFPCGREVVVVMERSGETLQSVVGDARRRVSVTADDREPLRLTAQGRPLTVRRSRLYFGAGESLAPPPKREARPDQPPKWETILAENFQLPDSLTAFAHWPEPTVFFRANNETLQMGPNTETKNDECWVMLKRSLPGDVRIRFRVRSQRSGQGPFFGVILNLKGKLRREDGYFIEWNTWQVQIKKSNVRKIARRLDYPKKTSNGEWLACRLEKIGAKITMYTEDDEVLTWTDPYPYADAEHDLLAFYTWRVPLQFDDLVIDRNRNDPLRPRADHPVFPENYLEGLRQPPAELDEF